MRGLLRSAVGVGVAGWLAATAVPAQAITAPEPARSAPAVRSAPAARPVPAGAVPARAVPARGVPASDQARLGVLRRAGRRAHETGRAVPVTAATTPTSVTVARPDGQFVTTTSVLPARVRQAGRWVPVSAALRRASAGYRPAATPSGLTLSAGGPGPLAVMTSPMGGRLAFSVPFALPRPAVSGDTATYRGVLPGVDLVVTVSDQGGFTDVLVIRDAAAAADPALARLRLATSARGLTVATDAHGNLTATASDGKVEFTAPAPRMWDSAAPRGPAAAVAGGTSGAASTTTGPGPRARVAAVRMRAVAGALVLVPDQRMLTARTTKYPVYIDPSISPTSSNTAGYVEAQQGCASYENYNDSSITQEGVGWQDYSSSCYGLYRSYFQLTTTNLNSAMDVTSATLNLQEVYGADEDCSDTWPVTLEWATGITPTGAPGPAWRARWARPNPRAPGAARRTWGSTSPR